MHEPTFTEREPGVLKLAGFEQQTTRGERLDQVELGESFTADSIDFSRVMGHLQIHRDGAIAGSQFSERLFPTTDSIVASIVQLLKERETVSPLKFDQFGRAEFVLTVDTPGQPIGWTGVKSLDEIQRQYAQWVVVHHAPRMPGGEVATENGLGGVWYPEQAFNPETKRMDVVRTKDGSVKNPHG